MSSLGRFLRILEYRSFIHDKLRLTWGLPVVMEGPSLMAKGRVRGKGGIPCISQATQDT